MLIEVSANPVETFVDSAQVDAVISQIDESSRPQAGINGGGNIFAIAKGTTEKGLEINQGDIRDVRA